MNSGLESEPKRNWLLLVTSVFVISLMSRLLVAELVRRIWGNDFAPDQVGWRLVSQLWANSQPLDEFQLLLYRQYTPMVVVDGLTYRLFGDSLLLRDFPRATLSSLTSVVLTGISFSITRNRRRALIGGIAFSFFPSSLLWGSLFLKEAWVWLSIALSALGVHLVSTKHCQLRIRCPIVLGAALLASVSFLLLELRLQTYIVVLYATLFALLFAHRPIKIKLLATSLLLMAIPMFYGLGFGATKAIHAHITNRSELQSQLAENAESSFFQDEVLSSDIDSQKPAASDVPLPTPAENNTSPPVSDIDVQTTRFSFEPSLPRLFLGVSLRPYIWEQPSGTSEKLAALEFPLWLGLYFLAIRNFRWKGSHPTLLFCAVFSFSLLIAHTLFQGNLGTAFRHRGQILFPIILLASIEPIRRRRLENSQ